MTSSSALQAAAAAATATTALISQLTTTTAAAASATAAAAAAAAAAIDHDDDKSNGECRLLGPFAILVQSALGVLALVSLVYKRWKERPQRPVKVWAFDASKQVFGSALLHVANLAMSLFSSGKMSHTPPIAPPPGVQPPNPCSFYLLNLAIDTTIGIPILVVILKVLHVGASYTPLARPPESIKSGYYGDPPKVTWWLKQAIIYFVGLLGMKICVFFIFQLCPWIVRVGDWALRWTEGNEAIQIAFVLLIFPLIMNAMQYYIIDTFIKGKGSSCNKPDQGRGQEGDEHDGHDGHEHGALLSGRQSADSEDWARPARPVNDDRDDDHDPDHELEARKIRSSHESAKPTVAVYLKEHSGRRRGNGGNPEAGESSTPESGG